MRPFRRAARNAAGRTGKVAFVGNPTQELGRGLVTRLTLLCVLLLVLANAFISQRALDSITREVEPEFNREAALVGGVLASQIARALELGMPLQRLVGMDEFLDPVLSSGSAFVYLAVSTPDSQVLYARGRQLDVLRRSLADGLAGAMGVGVPGTAAGTAAGTGPGSDAVVSRLGGLYDTAIPIVANGQRAAVLHVGVDVSTLSSLYGDTRWDVAIVLLVSLLTTIELLAFLVDRTLGTPLRLLDQLRARVAAGDWRARAEVSAHDEISRVLHGLNAVICRANGQWQRLAWLVAELAQARPVLAARLHRVLRSAGQDARFPAEDAAQPAGVPTLAAERRPPSGAVARLPLFVYVFAEQLSTSFMPIYARSLYRPLWGLQEQVLIGLPITVFMAGIAFVTPTGGRLVRRFGPRRVLLMGMVPACIGYLLTALADSLPALVAARGITAVGYSFITIGAQGYLAAAAQRQQRARSMGVFVGAVMAGAACGTAVGAVIADRIGYASTFLVSAALVAVSALVAITSMEPTPPAVAVTGANAGATVGAAAGAAAGGTAGAAEGSLRMLLRNPRFVALVLFAAIPAKVVLTGFIFYLAPLYLLSLNVSQPEIGRIVMAYALFMILTIGASARVSDRLGVASQQILWAGVLTGLGMLAVLFLAPTPAVLVAIIACGLCQGVAAAPMLAIIPEICPEATARLGQATLMGYLRMAERVGSMGGPFIAAGLVVAIGYSHAIVAIGLLSSVTAVLYWVGTRMPAPATAQQAGAG